MICLDGPAEGREVSPLLGERWPWVLTPWYGMAYADRIIGWYENVEGDYMWQGVES